MDPVYIARSRLLVPFAALVLTVCTFLGAWVLVQRDDASHGAQLQIVSLTLSLSNLDTASLDADRASGRSEAASRAELRTDDALMSRGLIARDQPGVPARLLAAGRSDLDAIKPVVKTIYGIAAHDGFGTRGARVPKLDELLLVRSAGLSDVLGKIAKIDAARSRGARKQAGIVVAVAMLLLLLGFALFYFRAAASHDVVVRLAREKAAVLRTSAKEARQAAKANALARDEAVEASNTKSMFVATVSHELRTPLTGVIGMTELVLDSKLEPEQHEYIQLAHSAAEGLLLVINDILDYSKIEAGKIELDESSFSLRETVTEACAMLLIAARNKGVELVVDIDSGLPAWSHGDAARLRQIVINLVSNAVKFTAAGKVTVTARGTPLDGITRVRVEVADSGIGIDEPTLARLFQPFTQADNSTARKYGGTGLGLTISARLIEAMGGEIGASSEPGRGSTFWFEVDLPAAASSDQPKPLNPDVGVHRPPISPVDGAPLILVAEDNPVNQIIVARMLEKLGYEAALVGDGHEALIAIERTAYAAVLMDCQMPEMDGYEATREIRRNEHASDHLAVIAMTAHSMPGDREKCLTAGMDDYISKPIQANLLREILARSVSAHQALAHQARTLSAIDSHSDPQIGRSEDLKAAISASAGGVVVRREQQPGGVCSGGCAHAAGEPVTSGEAWSGPIDRG